MEASARSCPHGLRANEKQRREFRGRLAANLRSERRRLGLTQEKAAEKAGYSLQYLQRIEREIVNVPRDTVARLAHALQVDPARLLRGCGQNPSLASAGRGRSGRSRAEKTAVIGGWAMKPYVGVLGNRLSPFAFATAFLRNSP